jgi:hypothetical protein
MALDQPDQLVAFAAQVVGQPDEFGGLGHEHLTRRRGRCVMAPSPVDALIAAGHETAGSPATPSASFACANIIVFVAWLPAAPPLTG